MTTQVLPSKPADPPTDPLDPKQRVGTSRTIQLACAWSAVPMVLLLMTGLVALAGFIPPIHPNDSAEEVARIYREDTDGIRFGIVMSFMSVVLLFPFGSAIAAQTRRIEGASPVLSYTQISSIGSSSIILVVPFIIWLTAAFRPTRAASEIQLLNDLGWILFVPSVVAFMAWVFAVGVAILSDARAQPVYPRWVGYLNIFVGLSFVPAPLVPFFKTGPFAWNGLFTFYIPFATFLLFVVVMMIFTIKAIKQQAAEASGGLRG